MRERLARAGLAAAAVAVVVDAVTRGVATAALPAVVALALAVAWPRLRPGWRAVLALVCGGLALAAAGALGASADGARSAAGGLALLAAGARTAWRARRRPRPLRAVAWGLGAAVGMLFMVLPVGFGIVATHRAKSVPAAADLGAPYRQVTLRTGDGLRLAGWYVPSRNRAAVIVFPGRRGTVAHARMLVRHGYGVLLLDRRGEGASEGTFNAYGWGGDADVRAAVAYLRTRPDVDPARVGGLGLSVGGEMLLQAAAHDRGLAAVVSEGAGQRSVAEMAGLHGALGYVSPTLAQTATTAVLSGSAPPPDLASLIGRIAPRPVLLVAGGRGHGDERELNPRYARAGGPSVRLWQIPGAGHTGGLSARPAEYERRVVGFLDRALLRSSADAVRPGAD